MPTGTNNITEVNNPTTSRMVLENMQYVVLLGIMVGQAVCAVDLIAGQFVFLVVNIIGIGRVFALNRPLADKVKDVACLGLTLTILAVKFLG